MRGDNCLLVRAGSLGGGGSLPGAIVGEGAADCIQRSAQRPVVNLQQAMVQAGWPLAPGSTRDYYPGEFAKGHVILDTYAIEALIARGGMGEVYRVRHRALESQHVVKILRPELCACNPNASQLARREAAVLRTIRHDAVVGYEGFFKQDDRWILVMEYVAGPSLADFIADHGPLSLNQTLVLGARLLAGLGAAHAQGIVHRDLSPDNIVLPKGRLAEAKIVDFGIAKYVGVDEATLTGDFAGKLNFVAPEQLGLYGGEITVRSDLYSLALVLAAAALGRPLAMDGNPVDAVVKRRRVPHLQGIPRELRRQLMTWLQPDPRHRPRSVAAARRRWPVPRQGMGWGWRLAATGMGLGLLTLGMLAGISPLTSPAALWWSDAAPSRSPAAAPNPGLGSPLTVGLGSTPAERERAYHWCRQSDLKDSCRLVWYQSEVQRRATLRPFAMDTLEVTNGEFAAFVAATDHVTTAERTGKAQVMNFPVNGFSWRHPWGPSSTFDPDHPVSYVSHDDAAAYCHWRGGRLPSRDEWEFAARGLEGRQFPWGDTWELTRAHWNAQGPVVAGSRPGGATPGGIYDLAGNVWEWTAAAEGEATARLKGGSWLERTPAHLRAAASREAPRDSAHADGGFRCVRDVEAWPATLVAAPRSPLQP